MAIEKQQEINESQTGLTLYSKQHHNKTDNYKPCFVDSPTFNSSRSLPSTDAIIIIDDDDEDVTLEPKKKKRRLGSWWDNVEAFDELMCVVKGAPKAKENNDDVASRAVSCFSSTDLNETKTTEKKNDDEISLPKKKKNDDESVGEISTTTRNKKDYEHVTLEDLEVSMEDLKSIPWESFDTTWEIRSDPWFSGYTEDLQVSL